MSKYITTGPTGRLESLTSEDIEGICVAIAGRGGWLSERLGTMVEQRIYSIQEAFPNTTQ